MHDFPIDKLPAQTIRDLFGHMTDPPKRLFIRGTFPQTPAHGPLVFLTVIGSRRPTPYGIQTCQHLIKGLRGYPIVIVSGLAFGIDALAHESAIETGLTTIAFPGSGLGELVIAPREHVGLAEKILEHGGCLLSEYEEHQPSQKWIFPERNRLMAGISHATLIIEATNKSGSRITTKLATDYNRDVLAVPGSIFSELSEAPNDLIKMGAIPVTSSHDIIEALGLAGMVFMAHPESNPLSEPLPLRYINVSEDEQRILEILRTPLSKNELASRLGMPIATASAILSAMEIKGLITNDHGIMRRIDQITKKY